jgi:lipoprotein-anchoring transpeptidase ErfK/SrfK
MNAKIRSSFYLFLALTSLCAVIGIAAWTVTQSSALSLNILATPARTQHFAFAKIAKPAFVATPVPTSVSSPAPISSDPQTPATPPPTVAPTETQISGPIAQVQIVEDAPAPQYSADTTPGQDTSAPTNYTGNKYILVDISEQHMYVYEGDTLVYSFVASTGMHNATRTGTFSVLDKIPNAYGATWDIWMPNWLGIYWAGSTENGIHALPILPNGATLWAGYLGTPISYGCIVLGTNDAQLLYDWADVGTPVEIRW